MTSISDFNFRLKPFKHQWREFKKHRDKRARMQLWSMRTGKSKANIDLACYNADKGRIDGVLIFAPNGVHENWTRIEIEKHHWDNVPYKAIAWSTEGAKEAGWQKKFEKYLAGEKLFWFSVNSESLKYAKKYIAKFMKHRRVLLLVDESDDFGIPNSDRTKMARAIAPRAEMVRTMSGTAVENSPLHAWSQYQLLKPGALGYDDYPAFKHRYAEYERAKGRGRHYEKLVCYRHLDELQEKMSKYSSVVLREDCEDMPSLMVTERLITMTEAQLKIYRDLHKQFTIEVGEGLVSLGLNTSRMMKLQQVCSGFVIDEAGVTHHIPGKNPKVDATMMDIYLTPGKVVVWCQFREDVRLLTERFRKEGLTYVEYHGGISGKQKLINRERFQEDKKLQILIGNPRSGGRGISTSAAKHFINHSHTFDAKVRKQALERCTVAGGSAITGTDMMVANSVEMYIRRCVDNKISIAAQLAGFGMKKLLRETQL